MNEEEIWEKFMMSGKISDYLEYKNAVSGIDRRDGERNGNNHPEGGSPQGISRW
ncbi:MAG: hypothetical protein ACI4I9_07125 [Porcipelethomonas sp.]